jgi:hypothetical protein
MNDSLLPLITLGSVIVKFCIDSVQARRRNRELIEQREREAEDRESARVAMLEQIALGIQINREAIEVANHANEKIASVVEVANRRAAAMPIEELTREVRRIAGVVANLGASIQEVRLLVETNQRA